jgi:hypothetical protein
MPKKFASLSFITGDLLRILQIKCMGMFVVYFHDRLKVRIHPEIQNIMPQLLSSHGKFQMLDGTMY